MILSFKLSNNIYEFDSEKGIDISIPLNFHGEQPEAYGAEIASAEVYISDNFIGDTRKGGSCNFEKYTFIPHCNGTHTECVGHISLDRIFVNETLKDTFIPCTLISVKPENPLDSNETYIPEKNKSDCIITKKLISGLLKNNKKDFLSGLIIRTLPNDVSKMSRDYLKVSPPFFSIEAMEFIASLDIKHLLVDIPSVDRTFDEGKLFAHHIFWNVAQGSHDVDEKNHSLKTITEMVYIPDKIKDGQYLLNLQIASFMADASPSRPMIFELKIKN
jgi:arylformamidase